MFSLLAFASTANHKWLWAHHQIHSLPPSRDFCTSCCSWSPDSDSDSHPLLALYDPLFTHSHDRCNLYAKFTYNDWHLQWFHNHCQALFCNIYLLLEGKHTAYFKASYYRVVKENTHTHMLIYFISDEFLCSFVLSCPLKVGLTLLPIPVSCHVFLLMRFL
jgi:hypothetical protein